MIRLLAWIARTLTGLAAGAQRAAAWLRRAERRLPFAPRLMCEACGRQPADPEMTFWSEEARRGVAFCRWCGKRFLRVNEQMATGIKTRRRRRG